MIEMQTKLRVTDNSGAKSAVCIKVLGGSKHMVARLGDVIVVSISEASPNAKVAKGEVCKALIVRTKFKSTKIDNSFVSFDDNAVVLVKDDFSAIATRIFGPVSREINSDKFSRILSISEEVL